LPAFLPPRETTLAGHLKKPGYTMGLVGKWHPGERPPFHPNTLRFDEFRGWLGGNFRQVRIFRGDVAGHIHVPGRDRELGLYIGWIHH
jgi:arylsulfatase A-like enzyme